MDSSDEFLAGDDEWDDSTGEEEDSLENDFDAMEAELGEATPNSEKGGSDSVEVEYPFKVLPASKILELMNDYIREGANVLELPLTTMRLLLNHFGWDKEKLMEVYWERDREELFREAGAPRISLADDDQVVVADQTGSREEEGVEDCEICYTENPKSMTFGLECGHRFCTDCWTSYLTTKITSDGQGLTISCAAHNCTVYVDDSAIMKLLQDPKVQLKYQQLITNGFVQSNRLLRWCPATDCSNAIRVQWVDSLPVTCACGHRFCFGCGHNWHAPIDCALLKKWQKKLVDDSESYQWITVNTKPCPKCNVDIEKNGGCNHMRCTNVNCNTDFCWMCLTVFGANYYCKCRDFRGLPDGSAQANATTSSREMTRLSLLRFGFYNDRYMNQQRSLELEGRLYSSVESQISELQLYNSMSWVELQFLKKAVDILGECRRILVHTYILSYYLDPDHSQSVIFEQNQRDLENATEILSEYLERNVGSAEDLQDIKMKVQDKTSYCEGRRKALLDHVKEGNDKGLWVHLE